MKQCVVSFLDIGGIRHSVEVQADSMHEAAAAALESFHEHDCSPGRGSELEVQVRSAVTHTITVKKLEDWANSSGASPRDAILNRRIKAVLPTPVLPATRGSERRGRAFNAEQT